MGSITISIADSSTSQFWILFYGRNYLGVIKLSICLILTLRTILPIIILSFSNLRLLCLINKDSSWPDNQPHHHHHKVYTLLAVVFFFIIFNFPYLVVIVWDILDFHRLLACQQFDKHIGYSTVNLVYTDIGKGRPQLIRESHDVLFFINDL